MTKEQALTCYKHAYKINNLPPLTEGIYQEKGSRYVQVPCPYCKIKIGTKDPHQHLHLHYEQEWYKCMRCGSRGPLKNLLGNFAPKEKKEEPWENFISKPEEQIPDQNILIRNQTLQKSNMRPGATIPLENIPRSHPAWQFLIHDGFDPEEILKLSRKFGIFYCTKGKQITQNEINTTSNRLIFEIRNNLELVGWQARWLPKHWPPSKTDLLEEQQAQKYLISPGLPKSYLLYNFDYAKNWDTWIVVEGIKKVWKTGEYAVACFGINNSPNPPEGLTEEKTSQFWSVRLARAKRPVVFLYDKGAEEQAKIHTETIKKLGNPETYIAHLPEDGPKDLDQYTTAEIRQIIKNTIKKLPRKTR